MDRVIACLAIIGFVVVLFVLGDRTLGSDRRRELGGWLIDELPADARVDSLPRAFIEWFDRLFQTRAVGRDGPHQHHPSPPNNRASPSSSAGSRLMLSGPTRRRTPPLPSRSATAGQNPGSCSSKARRTRPSA